MPNDIRTRCPHCDAGLKLKDRSALGTKKRCPNCGERFTVRPTKSRNSTRRKRKPDEAEFDEFDDEFAPPPRRSGSARRAPAKSSRKPADSLPTKLIWLLIGGGVVVLLLVVGISLLRQRSHKEGRVAEMAQPMTSETVASSDAKDKSATSNSKPETAKAAPKSSSAEATPAKVETTASGDRHQKAPQAGTGSSADGTAKGDAIAKRDQDASQNRGETTTADSSSSSVDEEPDTRGRKETGATSAPPPASLPAAAEKKDRPLINEAPRTIKIDGKFDDWAGVTSYTDPEHDTHDVDHHEYDKPPGLVEHADTDLVEYKVAHDAENLYLYFRARGQLCRTHRSQGKDKGRYYVIVTIDVDQNDETGYWIHEGGYWPTSRGYDVNAEVEYYGGEFNTGHYLNHGCRNEEEKNQAFLDQSSGKYLPKKDGPYKPGFMRLAPGTYRDYTQWVYHTNDTITFVRDKGPVVRGIVRSALSKEKHEIEVVVPYKGFLKDQNGQPIVALGKVLDLSFSLECSSELVKDKVWTSDTGEPIEGYVLTGSADDAIKKPRVGSSQ